MSLTERLSVLFAGNDSAYGTYEIQKKTQSGKRVGKADTIRKPPTLEHWENHVQGKTGLGIIPITHDNNCWWGCIDIDEYPIDHQALSQKLVDADIPVLVCTTKSGGAHVFAFFSEPVEASELQQWLKSIAAGIGHGESEIFPKQTTILKERGDVGNWLNMPYFGGDESDRKCVAPNGKQLTLKEFLKVAEKIRIAPDKLWDHVIKEAGGVLDEGPPCLQVLCENGFPEGTRNNGLFNLGVLAKKKFPEKWETVIEDMNRDFMDPPLESEEVQGIIKQHRKKEYLYKCDETPICQFCNSSVCKSRKYGIGSAGAMPALNGLTKLDTDPPIWFLTVEGQRMELPTDALQQQEKFQRACMEQLNLMPPRVKVNTWQVIVQSLLDNLVVIEQPEDTKMTGVFIELLEQFTTARSFKERETDLLRGLPYTDAGYTFFRLADFLRYCKNQGVTFERNFAAARIRDTGGEPVQKWIKESKRNVLCWKFTSFALPEEFELSKPEEPKL